MNQLTREEQERMMKALESIAKSLKIIAAKS